MWKNSSFFLRLGEHRIKTAGVAMKLLSSLTTLGAKKGIIPPEVLARHGLPVPKTVAKTQNLKPEAPTTTNQEEKPSSQSTLEKEKAKEKEKGEGETPS